MRKLSFITIMLTVLSISGINAALAQGEEIESHAYLYVSDEMSAGRNPLIVVEQPGTVRFIGCFVDNGTDLPKTPTELMALIAKPSCLIVSDQLTVPGIDWKTKLIHQKQSDRFIQVASQIQWLLPQGTNPQPGVTVNVAAGITFDKNAKDTVNLLYSFITYVDGQNPEISTKRLTALKQYDTAIKYPVITDKPIER